MFKRKKIENKEFISTKQEIRESSKFSLKDLLGGKYLERDVVLRQIPFLLFVAAAILLYIFNQYRGENVMRQIMTLEKDIREMRAEAVSTAFDLQELSKQSEVKQMIIDLELPLQEAKTPPYKIVMDE
ncbi:MAG: FtsL-like putative cell division protein [Bacteroidales bacterium]|nr:FtsL-like putative cell division protein [Bacteroidales bacterium]